MSESVDIVRYSFAKCENFIDVCMETVKFFAGLRTNFFPIFCTLDRADIRCSLKFLLTLIVFSSIPSITSLLRQVGNSLFADNVAIYTYSLL